MSIQNDLKSEVKKPSGNTMNRVYELETLKKEMSKIEQRQQARDLKATLCLKMLIEKLGTNSNAKTHEMQKWYTT